MKEMKNDEMNPVGVTLPFYYQLIEILVGDV